MLSTLLTPATNPSDRSTSTYTFYLGQNLYSPFLLQCHLPDVKTNQDRCAKSSARTCGLDHLRAGEASHDHLLGCMLPLQNLFGEEQWLFIESTSDFSLLAGDARTCRAKQPCSSISTYTSSFSSSSTEHSLLPVVFQNTFG